MTTRKPHAAGTFYPADPSEIRRFCSPFFSAKDGVRPVRAVILPHAGYIYSGRTACRTLSKVEVPDQVLLIGPDHWSAGYGFSVYPQGSWQTPLGEVPVSTELASRLLESSHDFRSNIEAHVREHSLEVLLPLLQIKNPSVKAAPVIIETLDFGWIREVAAQAGEMLKSFPEPFLTVISNDMSHYEPDDVTRKKDRYAVDAILNLDGEALVREAKGRNITMCGIAAVVMLLAMKDALRIRKAELVEYTTSAEASGDTDRVVGYAGFIFE